MTKILTGPQKTTKLGTNDVLEKDRIEESEEEDSERSNTSEGKEF